VSFVREQLKLRQESSNDFELQMRGAWVGHCEAWCYVCVLLGADWLIVWYMHHLHTILFRLWMYTAKGGLQHWPHSSWTHIEWSWQLAGVCHVSNVLTRYNGAYLTHRIQCVRSISSPQGHLWFLWSHMVKRGTEGSYWSSVELGCVLMFPGP